MIHQLCVLHLYKVVFSAVLGIKRCQLMYHLFQSNKIDEGLFGAVPTKLCQDLVLLAKLQYAISQCTHKPLAKGEGMLSNATILYYCV